ncbi:hypothetical protein WN71_008945 [Streptomyces mangrovisoli]|uniref:Alpha-amlyase n=2 Tax=Streptomyces mangrovisoli TaxID=1428628 RepID=A0A1J4P333_9ACTN|nr:hypothetical protein [Streptomyces mangrovisoli]OIJ68164.1 hypothetical protein WN71_008945 [Streptomyces mangrovisoli]
MRCSLVAAGSVTALALALPLALSATASAAPAAAGPAPSCVAMYQSWRYLDAANNCADAVTVMAVYKDGATGLCYTLAPGAMTTVGAGYIGEHGYADHLELCGDA